MKFKTLALINSKKIINVFIITDNDHQNNTVQTWQMCAIIVYSSPHKNVIENSITVCILQIEGINSRSTGNTLNWILFEL